MAILFGLLLGAGLAICPTFVLFVILLWLGITWEPSDEECSMIITVRDPEIIETKNPIPRKKKYSREDSLSELQRQLDLTLTRTPGGSEWERQLKALEG